MDKQLIEQVTRMVVERMEQDKQEPNEKNQTPIKIWDHTSNAPKYSTIESPSNKSFEAGGKATFSSFLERKESRTVQKDERPPKESKASMDSLKDDDLEELKKKTPARIGVGRAGVRPKTNTWIDFRYDHAAAVDAVYGKVDQSLLRDLGLFTVNTKVNDKETYIRRPDYGRKLSDEAVAAINDKCKKKPQVQIIVSDGLSSKAIDENLEDVYLSLQQSLKSLGLEVGTPFFIEKGRVAAMDDVGEQLKPDVIIYLIGERPGLVSAESLSAYLCYKPRHDSIESQRQVVSNIHRGGIPPVEAGAYLGGVIEKILDYEASGVELVQKER
ncbi:ethanolamine ammonia-lyase subunit EutC [Halobacillus yeomjeoni]|uniref:Ethanolamine ammonia-lyase small subunit n=1 Tax=Halobacillus yeomjeoni TaxID=311194 RepID=A0A931HUM2_9BACI|nr:ethanolamine ammonia-lyase subunit EutC [Halobacillus yeomjeoni]MBH0229718.1 ethanolamine ammonia-lyase subunit EutC [Halobacillus yeomjeoni]